MSMVQSLHENRGPSQLHGRGLWLIYAVALTINSLKGEFTLTHKPRAMTVEIKGPWKHPKGCTMGDRTSIMGSMGPQG